MIINQSLDPPGPFGRRVFLAERLPGDRLQEMDLECLVLVLEHLVGQVKHLDIHLDAQTLAQVGQTIEEVGVVPLETDGDNVTMVLQRLLDKGFLPLGVADDPSGLARAKPRGEGDDLVVGTESLLDQAGVVAALGAMLVDRDEDVPQVGDEEQQVVDQVTDPPVVTLAQEGGEADAVHPAQGMVGGENVTPIRRGQVFLAIHLEPQAELADQRPHEVDALDALVARQDVVDLLLMDNTGQIVDRERRNLGRDLRRLRVKHLLDINL